VKYSDTKSSSFAELKVGDQLRALGTRSADGARYTPEEIVSGSFKTILGTVASVDVVSHTVKITPSGQKQQITVVISDNSNVRKLDPQAGQMLAFITLRAVGGGMPGAGGANTRFGGGAGQPAGGASPQGGEARRPEGAAGGQGGAPGVGQRRMMGGGGFDLNDVIDRQPQAKLADLKPGDVVIVSSTTGADPTRVNAITLLAGAEPVLMALQMQPPRAGRASGASDLGLPAGIDLGIGLP
jgi:hypothetical protein